MKPINKPIGGSPIERKQQKLANKLTEIDEKLTRQFAGLAQTLDELAHTTAEVRLLLWQPLNEGDQNA